jgi:hypothetical protein
MHAPTIDEMHADLHGSGWSLGEIAYDLYGRRIWQVDARRGEKWIVSRDRTQTAAWREAWREARGTSIT